MSILEPKCSGMTGKNVLPTEGGKHFFENVVKKSMAAAKLSKKGTDGGCDLCIWGPDAAMQARSSFEPRILTTFLGRDTERESASSQQVANR